MSQLTDQWIDLFRAGDYSGKGKGVFSEQDVQQIVDNYDPAIHEAFTAIGHPKGSAPAFGWWGKLRRVGDLLQGKMSTVQPEFEEMLNRKLFKKRSVGLVKAGKGWTLHHVAFLGAQAPEIKGLADIKFEQGTEEVNEIEFSEEISMADQNDAIVDSVWSRFLDKIKGFSPSATVVEPGARSFSEDDVKRIAKETADAAVAAAVGPLQTQFSERETSLATAEAQSRAQTAITKVKAAGAWVPAFEKMGLSAVFEDLAKDTVTVEFGEGATKGKKTTLEIFTEFMEGLKTIVPNAPVWTGQQASSAGAPRVEFNETQQVRADENSVLFDAEIKKRMAADKVDYGTAMTLVANERPELTRPGTGGASAGQA